MTSAASILERIQVLHGKFSADCNADECNEISTSLLEEIESLDKCTLVKDESLLAKIHSVGIDLWNLVITKKTGKKISSIVCARVRYASLRLTFIANFQDNSQNTSRKQLAMALKTGREWLDCNNHDLADKCFVLASECYMKLLALIGGKGEDDDPTRIHLTDEQLTECHQNMLRVHVFRAEVSIIQSQHATALQYLGKAKELLMKYKKLGEFLCGICYNFGLDLYQKELYSYSAEWLRESIEIGKDDPNVKDEQQATTGQLLAVVYMGLKEESYHKKALEVIETSILMQPHIKSVFLKIKILLLLNEEETTILRAFNEMLLHPQVSLDLALECVDLFNGAQRKNLSEVEEALNMLNKKYPRLQENVRVQLARLETLLSEKKIKEANELITTELLRSSNQGIEIDKNTLRKLQLIIWEQAQIAFENKDFMQSLQWYNYSEELMKMSNSSDQQANLSKLQRNRCSCLIELHNYDQACKAAKEAEVHEPSSPHVHFLLFKIALLTHDDEKASQAAERLNQLTLELPDSETVHGLVCLAAQLAFELGNRSVSETLLESMVVHVTNPTEALITIRCLTRLKFTSLGSNNDAFELQKILEYVQKAYQILLQQKNSAGDKTTQENEIIWFNKIAWNLALSCNNHFLEMQKSFQLCYELSTLLPEKSLNVSQQKSSLLMAIGSGLQLVRSIVYENEKKTKLRELLELIQKYKDLNEALAKLNPGLIDPNSEFLLSYEFETKTRLGYLDVDHILEKTMDLPSGHVKMFETYANIALSLKEEVHEIGLKALKLAIKYHLDEEHVDYTALSKDIHRLINVSIQTGGKTNAESKEDAYRYYEDALKIIDNLNEGDYPEMELVWLMTKAWNCGIHLFSAQQYEAAEKWCSLSIKLLKYLKALKGNYDAHMSKVYAEVINRIQEEKGNVEVKGIDL